MQIQILFKISVNNKWHCSQQISNKYKSVIWIFSKVNTIVYYIVLKYNLAKILKIIEVTFSACKMNVFCNKNNA